MSTLKAGLPQCQCHSPRLRIFRAEQPTASVAEVLIDGKPATLSIYPPETWTWMTFPAGVGRASGGEWFTLIVE